MRIGEQKEPQVHRGNSKCTGGNSKCTEGTAGAQREQQVQRGNSKGEGRGLRVKSSRSSQCGWSCRNDGAPRQWWMVGRGWGREGAVTVTRRLEWASVAGWRRGKQKGECRGSEWSPGGRGLGLGVKREEGQRGRVCRSSSSSSPVLVTPWG